MSELKLCQGPRCHRYQTKDRLKGMKDNKTYQTRRRSNLLFDEFCSMHCYNDWFRKYGTQAVNHFGRLNEAKHLTEHNAWTKDYDWRVDDEQNRYFLVNSITRERRPLTEAQYRDSNYTINTGE